MNRSAAILFLSLFVASSTVAQQKLPPAEETIDVSIVNVDVFVADKDGRRVSGLTPDDFEIRENGRVQPITNFAEYSSGASDAAAASTKAPHAKRTILVFVERFALPNFRTKPLFAAIRKTLREVVRPGDSAAIVYWDLDAAFTLQDFTDDLPSLEAALGEVEKQSTGAPGSTDIMRQRALARSFVDSLAPERLRGRRTLDNPDLWDLKSNANFSLFRFERKAEELQALMRSMSDEDGRKIVIFATDDFGLYPESLAVAGDLPAFNPAEYGTTQYRDAVARTANEHNITIYPFYPVGLQMTPMVSAAENRPDLYANPQIDRRAGRDFQVLVNQTAALDELAKETGGLMASGTNEIVSVLPQVAQDLESYYSLAYPTPATGTTKSRDIVVRAKNRDYTVRSRREYVEKTDITRMQDRVIANLYRPDGKGRIPLDVNLGTIEKDRKHWTVPVRIRIPIEALSIGRNDTGTFSVFIATGGILGIMSDVERRTQSFSFADIAPEQSHFTYDFTMRFNGATSTVSIGVFDERTKDFGLQTVELPAFRKEMRAGGE